MNGRRLLKAGLILALLAGAAVAALLASSGGDREQGAALSTRQEERPPTAAPAEPRARAVPIRFVLSDRHETGDAIDVAIENVGTRAYVFQSYYQACFLAYLDASGRRFIIPPGTHCDLLAEETIRPGERKKLFRWKLDECVKDDWGCVKSRPLAPGTYTIKGRFEPKRAGPTARVEATFQIVAS